MNERAGSWSTGMEVLSSQFAIGFIATTSLIWTPKSPPRCQKNSIYNDMWGGSIIRKYGHNSAKCTNNCQTGGVLRSLVFTAKLIKSGILYYKARHVQVDVTSTHLLPNSVDTGSCDCCSNVHMYRAIKFIFVPDRAASSRCACPF